MLIDSHTLQDLDLLYTRDPAASLFEWARCTRTRGGERRLMERFKHPLHDPAEIRATQDAVRFLMQHGGILEHLLYGSNWLVVEQYAKTAYRMVDHPDRLTLSLGSWWIRLHHNDVLEQIRIGLATLQRLAVEARTVVGSLESLGPPHLIREWMQKLQAALESPALDKLLTSKVVHRRRFRSLLVLDWMMRSTEFAAAHELAALVYEVDALCSLARATRKHRLVFPEILDRQAPFIEADGVYHPHVREPVGNPVEVSDASSLLFITGPNTAGKTTYLKAVGAAVFFAQLGMGVPAARMRLAPFECLFTGLNTTDNVLLGQSYFFREVRRVRQIAEILQRETSALAIFDEMFKGTNLKDASDGCSAVLSRFTACPGSAFLVASHIAELADELRELPGVRFCHFAADVAAGEVRCDYLVRPGVSTQRLGMFILRQEGVLKLLEKEPTPGG